MKRLLLLPIGLIPLLAGFGMNYLIMEMNLFGALLTLISLAFTLSWFFVGFTVAGNKMDTPSVIGFSLAFGILNYIFIVFQLLILDRWTGNIWGLASQLYTLPTISLVRLVDVFNVIHSSFGFSTCAMFILFAIFFAGVTFRRRSI